MGRTVSGGGGGHGHTLTDDSLHKKPVDTGYWWGPTGHVHTTPPPSSLVTHTDFRYQFW